MPTKKLRGQPPTEVSGNVEGVYAGSYIKGESDGEMMNRYKGSGIKDGSDSQEDAAYRGSRVKSKGEGKKVKHIVKTQNAGY